MFVALNLCPPVFGASPYVPRQHPAVNIARHRRHAVHLAIGPGLVPVFAAAHIVEASEHNPRNDDFDEVAKEMKCLVRDEEEFRGGGDSQDDPAANKELGQIARGAWRGPCHGSIVKLRELIVRLVLRAVVRNQEDHGSRDEDGHKDLVACRRHRPFVAKKLTAEGPGVVRGGDELEDPAPC